MTPAEHLAAAEYWLDKAAESYQMGTGSLSLWAASIGTGHALVALAAEAGVPHQPGPQDKGASDGAA